MVKFAHVVVAYAVMGALMWGGGMIAWDESGVSTMFLEDPTTGDANADRQQDIQGIDGRISQIVGSFASALGLFAIWNIVVKIASFMFWPIVVLNSVNAPPRIVAILGTPLTAMFFMSFLQVVRGST